MYYIAFTCDETGGYSWEIHPAVDKINKVSTRKILMRRRKPWPIENKQYVDVNHGQCKTGFVCVNRHGHVGRAGILVKNFGWSQFPRAVPTPVSSFECANFLRLLSSTVIASPSKNKNMKLYIYMFLVVCKI